MMYVARHLAKRAPSSRYSARRSRRPSSPSVTVSPSAARASCLAPLSTLMPGMIPLLASSFGNGTPSLVDWRMVSSNRITPLMNSSTPSVVKRRSRYARRFSSVDSTPILSKRFLIVPVLSSAARMPLPGATIARAVLLSSDRFMPVSRSRSLPLDGSGWLAGDVVGDPVDPGHFVDDPRRDALEHLGRQAGPVGGHRVVGGYRPHDDRIFVRPLVTHDAHRTHDGQHGKALPDLPVQPRPPDLVEHDRVGLAQDVETLGRDRAGHAHGKARAGEGLAPHDL